MTAYVESSARSRQQDLRIALDASALGAHGHSQWLALFDFAAQAFGRRASISSFSGSPPDREADFAYITDSAALSRKLWLNVPLIYVQPRKAPDEVDAYLYWKSFEQSDRVHSWRPAARTITLISSVFRGDDFLPGFLDNCGGLHGYGECEHFLIRAGSPGSEHDRLVEHVRRYPAAVYMNLANDPGLYEVWNLGARLARGRYLSNANIDDRRAPEHLTRLQAILDSKPDIDVASTALRVTKQRNTRWQDSDSCAAWFADGGDMQVAVDGLFKATPSGLGSRNLPNCMPMWRRSLHARLGWFDEKRYGPSADWAFWVRAGMQGSQFYLSAEPLGLYLRDEESYWHRDPANREADRRIVAEYTAWLDAGNAQQAARPSLHRTLSREIGDALDQFRGGAVCEGLGALLRLALQDEKLGVTEHALLDRAAEQFLGCADFKRLISSYGDACRSGQLGDVALFNAWVDLLHTAETKTAKSRRALELACIDLSECFGDARGLLMLALLARRRGDQPFEHRLLRRLHDLDRAAFWRTVQRVYRFTAPLPAVCEAVSEVSPGRMSGGRLNVEHQVVFYPNVTGNAYQDLLYRPIRESGGLVWGTSDAEAVLNAAVQPGAENILHIHWINRLFRPGDSGANRREQFLEGLRRQQRVGFRVFWTIHNYLSHETENTEAEIAFRQALYRLCDRVFIHHPLAAELLDWLPDRAKLSLCEHGHYDLALESSISRVDARARLGFNEDDFVVAHLGQIRDYKGLDAVLPLLLEHLQANPRMKVVVGGRILSSRLRSWLNAHPHENLIVHDRYLGDDELHCLMAAADFGLLSYSAILTSGSLVHWFSAGRPVFAPMLGTIPAYVVDGWNGYLYRDAESLGGLLRECAQRSAREWSRLSDNARTTAQQMEWRMWAS